ncbi:DUF397 domain-containing protein [Actinoalloteichus fjordicus]|uniref:DUF397 family protein n=1 Tax=Actinoalloteichus fjordicus TaxID=1612552 RepID=A0AAC9PTD1_9PSEU|nr:DUF397 domain-containing protein [Actinoalloteichus fjordicus]APU16534.1 putative DUF397 family protein [Actinoalloteichus fjordicus]
MIDTSALSRANWRTSSHSGGNGGECVEIGHASGLVGIRDSKHRKGGTLAVTLETFGALIVSIKEGHLD